MADGQGALRLEVSPPVPPGRVVAVSLWHHGGNRCYLGLSWLLRHRASLCDSHNRAATSWPVALRGIAYEYRPRAAPAAATG